MRTRFAPLACLAVLLTVAVLGGCTSVANPPSATPAPEVLEALEYASETDMEWGAAPWSPPGWPLKVGDRISQETFDELDKRFPSWLNGLAVNWIDGLPFGALIYLEEADSDTPFTYHGHFPRKISAVYETVLAETLPPHLRNRDTDHLFRTPEGYGIDWGIPAEDLREHWHEPWTGRFGDGGKGGGK